MSAGGKIVGIGCGMFVLLFIVLLGVLPGMICWPYTINSWLAFAGKPEAVEWWQGALIGLIPGFGQLSIPAAVVTWIIMLFL